MGTGGLLTLSEFFQEKQMSSLVLTLCRFCEELSILHTKFQQLLKKREDFESDLQRHYSTYKFPTGDTTAYPL